MPNDHLDDAQTTDTLEPRLRTGVWCRPSAFDASGKPLIEMLGDLMENTALLLARRCASNE